MGNKAKLGMKRYRKAFALAQPLIDKAPFFTAENEAIADLYRRNFHIDTEILPVPFGDVRSAVPSFAQAGVSFFRYSKCDKGFHLLPRAIELCRAQGLEADFTIQIQHGAWEATTVAAEADLRRIEGVRLIEGVLDEKDYVAETGRIDAMLLPYDPVLFGLRGSGIFTRSVSAGRPTSPPPAPSRAPASNTAKRKGRYLCLLIRRRSPRRSSGWRPGLRKAISGPQSSPNPSRKNTAPTPMLTCCWRMWR